MIPMNPRHKSKGRGFTLVELLVVIAIVAVLALMSFIGSSRFIEKGRKVQTMALFRDFTVGMTMFVNDYNGPPTPQPKRDFGLDTIYGDPGGKYSTQFLVSVLAGQDKDYPYGGDIFSAKAANPRGESYMVFKTASADKKYGVAVDGKLYDPWGSEVMVAINAFKSNNPSDVLVPFNNGQNDSRLHTYGLAEYKDTKPMEQAFVFWSYGKDKKKGNNGASYGAIVPYAGSDDVISW